MRETLPKEAVPQPVQVQPKAIPMSSSQIEEAPKAEVPLSLFVKAKFGELSSERTGCADATDSANSGEGLPRGKPLAKPKSKMDSYRVNKLSYHFRHALLDGPLRDHGQIR